jgi:hypothetical protein
MWKISGYDKKSPSRLPLTPNMLADTFALVTFAFAVGMFVEVVVSGLTLNQSLQSRLMAIPLNMIIARPYGVYRDWLFSAMDARCRGQLARAGLDIFGFITFMLPQYAFVLWVIGADFLQILTASASVMTLSLVIGRPYGLYLGLCRNMLSILARRPIPSQSRRFPRA